jgi:uncharacterized protein
MPRITSLEELDALYGSPQPPAIAKEIGYVSAHYKAFIDRAPFVVVATVGPEGLDCSPRGDSPGFVRVRDQTTLLMPDRRGNNRIDSLRNLVRDPRIALLFIIPGIGNTLRVNGRAEITTDSDLLASFAMAGRPPRSVLIISVERIYFQCPKALVRSRLWSQDAQIARSELPSTGTILESLSAGAINGAEYDRAYPQRLKETLY